MLIVGDIHGDLNLLQRIYQEFPSEKKIIVGDLVDSFVHSIAQQHLCVQFVLQQVDKGDTVCLLGNHEYSYLEPEKLRCSGYSGVLAALLMPHLRDIRSKFKHFVYDKDTKILYTHAGLTLKFWNKFELSFDNLEIKLQDMVEDDPAYGEFFWIGGSRYGMRPFGGPLWCDWNQEFQPVPGLRQVFGHTPIRKIETKGEGDSLSYNIDCLQYRHNILRLDEERNIFEIISL